MIRGREAGVKRAIAYWAATLPVALIMGVSGVIDLARPPMAVDELARLGYPSYFLLVLGLWKTLSAPALLAPRLPLLKEWAYAGVLFDLTGASASHAAVGDPAFKVVFPLLLTGCLIASWWLRPADRRLPGARFGAAEAA